MRGGARGYVLKDMDDEDIARAILAVGNGDAIFSPAIAERLMNFFNALACAAGCFEALPRHLRAGKRGASALYRPAASTMDRQRRTSLSFSTKTVRNYVSNIFSKLQVADRAQAIVKARKAGL